MEVVVAAIVDEELVVEEGIEEFDAVDMAMRGRAEDVVGGCIECSCGGEHDEDVEDWGGELKAVCCSWMTASGCDARLVPLRGCGCCFCCWVGLEVGLVVCDDNLESIPL